MALRWFTAGRPRRNLTYGVYTEVNHHVRRTWRSLELS